MDDQGSVRRRQTLCGLQRVVAGFAGGNGAFVQPLAECLALQQFRNDVGALALEANVENSQNIRVIERGGGASFLLESPEMPAMLRKVCSLGSRSVSPMPGCPAATSWC